MPLIIVVRSLKNSKLKTFGLFRFMEVKSHCVKDIRNVDDVTGTMENDLVPKVLSLKQEREPWERDW